MKSPRVYTPLTARFTVLAVLLLFVVAFLPLLSRAARQQFRPAAHSVIHKKQLNHVPGEILVRFRQGSEAVKAARSELALSEGGGTIRLQLERLADNEMVPGLRLARVASSETAQALNALNRRPDVLYAEPNFIRRKSAVPNDSRYSDLWGLKNSGQLGGTAGSDIKAEEAWNITTGSSNVVVAVIDEGIAVNHVDLQPNIWRNPGEIAGNGIDDDSNGFIDDVNGYDFVNNDGSVYDGPGTNPDGSQIDEHGTHVAGTIGAAGNNGIGVVGVSWQTSLMSLKFLGPNGGSTADLIRAFGYARMMRDRWVSSGGSQGANVRITNNSYGGNEYSQSESDAVQSLATSGILFVAAAGNESEDNDIIPTYPAGYDLPNIISVAATDRRDAFSSFSNRGANTVHLGAPGTDILSTVPGNSYDLNSGTSMASPHVAGAAALVLAAHPDFSVPRLRAALLFGGEAVASLAQTTETGRRLSALGSLQNSTEIDTTAPATVADFHAASQVGRSLTINWSAVGDDGNSGAAALAEVRFTDQTTGASYMLASSHPEAAGTAEFLNIKIPYRHTTGTVNLRVTDNAGNTSTTSFPVSVPIDDADRYIITEGPPEPLSTGGTRINANFDDVILGRVIPFDFPFFDRSGSTVNLSSNGTIYFPSKVPNNDPFSSASLLPGWRMIAGLWDDLDLSTSRRADADIYVVNPDPSRIIFRWQGVPCNFSEATGNCVGGDPVNFEIELRRDGTIVTRYGDGNRGLHPVVGLGGGERDAYVVDSHTSEIAARDLTNAPTVTYTLRSQPKKPNVTLSTGGGPQPVRVGQSLQFNIQLGNSGPDAAAAVTVTDIFPAETTLVSCTTTQGFCKSSSTQPNKLTVSVGSIAPGASATINLLLNTNTFPSGGSYVNSATVASAAESDKTSSAQIQAVRPNPNPLRGATSIGAGSNHSFAILSDGSVVAWGDNRDGQLGIENSSGFKLEPAAVPWLTNVASIDGGSLHSLAVKTDGTVWSWGTNFSGQLGDGTTTARTRPQAILGLTNFSAVAAGPVHSLALRADGTVWAWGYNNKGQLGDNSTTERHSPVQVVGLTNVISIGAGNDHSLAFKADGTVWTWGGNDHGQLGDGTTVSKSVPTQVSGLTGVTSVAAGEGFTLAAKSDGTVWAWGWNNFSQLGAPISLFERSTPAQVPGINSVLRVSAGNSFSAALRSDGTVWEWGNYQVPFNLFNVDRSIPWPVPWISGMTGMAAGWNHLLARNQDGTVWSWGDSNFAQLGDGSLGFSRWWPSEVSDFDRTPQPNPIDDSRNFVHQHYLDFLNREPDPGGWDYWTANITNCGTDLRCVHNRRIDVSAAFFIELEFQETGYVVYRVHRSAFGTFPGGPTRANVTFSTFMADRNQIVAGPGLPQSTANFANVFVQRLKFLAVYPPSQTNEQFVNKLFDTAGLTPFTTERQQQIDAMNNNGKTRAQVLLDVIEIPTFKTREYNGAFVLMQYFGYLRRDPEQGGYDFWLDVLNNRVPGNFRGMVCAFLTSAEYQHRFGTAVTRTDRDCGP